jgi:hypothetical protein
MKDVLKCLEQNPDRFAIAGSELIIVRCNRLYEYIGES